MIKNDTIIRRRSYLKLYWFSHRKIIPALIFIAIFPMALISYILLEARTTDFIIILSTLTPPLIVTIIILIYLIIIPLIMYSMSNKKYTYLFDENYIDILSYANSISTSFRLDYSAIRNAVEKKETIYLFTNDRKPFLIEKCGFAEGSPDKLKQLLTRKTGIFFKLNCKEPYYD